MFNFIFKLFSNDMGMDLGTATVLVYVQGQGIVLCEPSVVAVDKDSKEIIAIGTEAKRMLGRTPGNIVAVRPLRNGVIADFEITEKMIRYFIQKVHNKRTLIHPRIVIGIPSGITEVERRAVRESATQAGAREIFLIEEPMAAAIGAGIEIQQPAGNMIVDIGGGTTEVGVISLGGMVVSKSIDIAGDELNEAIIQYFRRRYNLFIGENTAEEIKIKIGSVFPLEEELSLEVKGRDQVTGLPKTITVNSEEIRVALMEPVTAIVSVVKDSLESTPAEIAADLVESGITIAGGGALLRGIDKLLEKETGLPVKIAEDPVTCVVRGTGKYLEELDKLQKKRSSFPLLS
ncbi:MAG: rod shape-determining protein [Endomicrobiia bacterium]